MGSSFADILGDRAVSVTPYPRERTVHGLFEDWADRTPDAPALRYRGLVVSYGELDRLANRLAHRLRRMGIGAEDRVGLCVRDGNWVVGALATLKAGGAYVPLDPAYPADRLRYMCRDAGVEVVLRGGETDIELAGEQVFLDTPATGREPETRLAARVFPESLAYVMYTSGSTGTPKGVAVGHRNIVRLVRSGDSIALGPGDTAVQAANISFDAATLETWGALLNGARLAGLEPGDVLVPDRFRQDLLESEADVVFLPTALLRQHALDAPGIFRSVRHLSFGGEQADLRTVRAVRRACPDTELVNLYGPTEITTYATAFRCHDLDGADVVPIGRATANSSAYVLDDELTPVPPETPGELYLGGDGVARGYLGRPWATAERFLPDPFATASGARMYRTGDLVQRRANGELEFLGRADRQVKVRGHRVEPAEVEAVLRGFPGLSDVVVTTGRDAGDDACLIAHVVLDDGLGVNALRRHLGERVPGYLVPAVFVPVDHLPLTPNGKVDTAALPAPEAAGAAPVTAGNRAERAVRQIWQDVLGVTVPAGEVHFPDLGGHSLAAARVRSRLSALSGVDVPLRLVFDHPTPRAQAAAVAELTATAEHLADTTAAPAAVKLDPAELLAGFED